MWQCSHDLQFSRLLNFTAAGSSCRPWRNDRWLFLNPVTIDFSHPFPSDKLHFIVTWDTKPDWWRTVDPALTKEMFRKHRLADGVSRNLQFVLPRKHCMFNIKKQMCRGSKVVKVTCVTADVLNGLKVKTVDSCQYFTFKEDSCEMRHTLQPCVFLYVTQKAPSSRCREWGIPPHNDPHCWM